MLGNFLLGLGAMTLCLFLQLSLLLVALRYYVRHEEAINSPSVWSSMVVINTIMLFLVLGNLSQVSLWALIFWLLGEFGRYSEAFYHSAVNFATLGYGDLVMSEGRRILGALEAINGVLMIGVSTAALMAAFNDAIRRTLEARKG